MFCKQCGKSLAENQAFCDGCGAPTAEPSQKAKSSQKIHCPHCSSNDLFPITSTEITTTSSGGGFSAAKGCLGYLLMGPFGILCGSCGSKSKTTVNASSKNYWTCRSCGKKFLDMADLDAQLQKEKAAFPRLITGFIALIVFAVIFIIAMLPKLQNFPKNTPPLVPVLLYSLLALIAMLPFILLFKGMASKKLAMELEAEKAFLEKNAYNTNDSAQ